MKIKEISNELQNIIEFEQESLKKIEEFEKMQKNHLTKFNTLHD